MPQSFIQHTDILWWAIVGLLSIVATLLGVIAYFFRDLVREFKEFKDYALKNFMTEEDCDRRRADCPIHQILR